MHRDLRNAPRTLLLSLILSVAVSESSGARDSSPDFRTPGAITPRLESLRRETPEATGVLWVYFRDKGLADQDAVRAAAHIAPRSERRRRQGFVPDTRDLPVFTGYVRALRRPGLSLRNPSRWLNAVSIQAPLSMVEDIAALPFVLKVDVVNRFRRPDNGFLIREGYLDPGVAPRDLLSDRVSGAGDLEMRETDVLPAPATGYPGEEALHYGPSFNQNAQIGIMDLHRQGYTGAGIRICILDTGFRTDHIAFQGRRLIAERDFVFGDDDVDNEPEDIAPAWNHGTSTWSNVGGFKPGAIIGGSFESEILLAKTEDIRSETPVEEDNYIAALEWADQLGADVASASLIYLTFDGGVGDHTYADLDGNTIPLSQAVDIAVSKGMAVVNAMGNSGPQTGTLGAPADADSAISVGAVDSLGAVAGFSSRGPTADGQIKPEVVARGVLNMVAASNGGFSHSSGTSFSTPITAGAVGLLLEAHPEWSGFDVRQALINTASHPGSPDNNTGYGLVNSAAAVDQSQKAPPHVSLPFALISPPRGATVPTAAPGLSWERSLAGAAGDTILYSVLFGTDSTLAAADTFSAGEDTTWIPTTYLMPGQTYHWTVLAENRAGWKRAAYMPSRFLVSATAAALNPIAEIDGIRLSAVGPNPFRSVTRLRYQLPAGSPEGTRAWSLDIFDTGGRHVRRLAAGLRGGGALEAEVSWDGRDGSGRRLAGGVYFVSLENGSARSTIKVSIAR